MRGKLGVFRAPPRKKRRAGTVLLRGSHCAGLEAARGFPSCAAVADFAGGRIWGETAGWPEAAAAWAILGKGFYAREPEAEHTPRKSPMS